ANVSPQYAVKAVQLILKNPERPSSMPGVASDGKFQIEADPENRRLLLWATSEELAEVREFLISLGETFEAPTMAKSQMHVVAVGASDIDGVTERLRQVWREVSNAPLVIERKPARLPAVPPRDKPAAIPNANQPSVSQAESDSENIKLVSSTNGEDASNNKSDVATAADVASISGEQATQPATASAESSLPAVRIIEGKKGDLVIISRDAEAASTARNLLQQLVPEPSDVRVIQLKYAQAMSVRRQLEEMLEHTAVAPTSKLSSPTPRVTIEVDARTNRLILQHCTAQQLQLINDYIPLLDQAPAEGDRMTRQQRVYRVKHRRVSDVVEVVKEVYRDLLSVNDRAFSSYNSYRPNGFNKNLAATANNPEYQGLMAVGADIEANLLVISAPGYLIDEIVKLAESVDTAVDGPGMAIVPAAGDVGDVKMREALSKILRRR
ncbi:MAG: hypothetical protein IT423_14910, partial [Pirellulaceae bacterium]|nr:hypothetical protein [Pirellulaceae bacterium]